MPLENDEHLLPHRKTRGVVPHSLVVNRSEGEQQTITADTIHDVLMVEEHNAVMTWLRCCVLRPIVITQIGAS